MSTHSFYFWLSIPALVAPVTQSAYAAQYLTLEEAQHVLFPDATAFEADAPVLNAEQQALWVELGGEKDGTSFPQIWRAHSAQGVLGYFVLHDVLGKHDFITYAVALSPGGMVLGVEILEYREHYGAQVRNKAWRSQFIGKNAASLLKVGEDIVNISGATISCMHVSAGVRRLVVLLQMLYA